MSSRLPVGRPSQWKARRDIHLEHHMDLHPLQRGSSEQLFLRFRKPPLDWSEFTPISRFAHVGALTGEVLLDIDRGLELLALITNVFAKNNVPIPHIALAIKKGNACGAAIGDESRQVAEAMVEGAPDALRESVVITNFNLTVNHAESLATYMLPSVRTEERTLRAVVAPHVSHDFYLRWRQIKKPLVAIENRALARRKTIPLPRTHINTELPMMGLWVQRERSYQLLDLHDEHIRSEGEMHPHGKNARDILLGWAVCMHSPSFSLALVSKGRLMRTVSAAQDQSHMIRSATFDLTPKDMSQVPITAVTDSYLRTPDGIDMLWMYGVRLLFAAYDEQSPHEAEVTARCRMQGMALMRLPIEAMR